jgi:hypothetical protein
MPFSYKQAALHILHIAASFSFLWEVCAITAIITAPAFLHFFRGTGDIATDNKKGWRKTTL